MSDEPLPVERLRPALAAWGLEDADVVEAIPPGATADVFLVRRGDERWVAKYAYQDAAYVDAGLAASELLDVEPWDVARPVRTLDGERYRLVPWPEGHDHPLALLTWVDGRVPAIDEPGAVERKATVCGRVHAQLLDLDPDRVGVPVPAPDRPVDPLPSWDLGPHQWLDDALTELLEETVAWCPTVRSCVGVWDGPDIRVRDDGGVGLIDFGHTSWQPLVNVVANRSLNGEDQGASTLARFLAALAQELSLTEPELEALESFRRCNAAGYARWAAMRMQEHGDEALGAWLDSLVRYLRSDRPAAEA